MKIKTERFTEDFEEFGLVYGFACGDGSGFSFPCHEDGTLILPQNPAAAENYAECLSGANGTKFLGVEAHRWSYTNPAVGECDVCGRDVELDGFTCPCSCGADYNSSGQRLAPRSQWGEDTGESLSDILMIP